MAFYKRANDEILKGENFVYSPIVTLKAEDKDSYEYPQDGWYWFDSFDAALVFFAGLEPDTMRLTPRQVRLQLLSLGLLDEVEALLATDKAMQIWFEYSLDFQRNHDMIIAMATQLGMTELDMDNFFIEANKL